jgi:RNA 3'-terminal phosphate cyclase (ATP)
MIEIDGSQGEGGGQVLRTALTLAAITGRPVRLCNVRAHRSSPGLKPQHLKAVEAVAAISGARVEGASLGSQTLCFEPQAIVPGRYRFDIGTAGSVSLVLQTLLLPLSFTRQDSHVVITGGTHVPWSPCYHYLAWHWLHYLKQAGFRTELVLDRAGYYPPGGGRISATISPPAPLSPLMLTERGTLKRIRGLAAVSNLDIGIAGRMRRRATQQLQHTDVVCDIASTTLDALSPGAFLLLLAEFEHSQACYYALGARGKPAEAVADEAVGQLQEFLATDGAIDEYLADQLVLPLALTPGVSELRTSRVTQHLVTNAEIVKRFLPVAIEISGDIGRPGQVGIHAT